MLLGSISNSTTLRSTGYYSMEYSLPRSPTVSIVDTAICNNNENSIQDMPPIPVVDTSACNSDKGIQDILSLLPDTNSVQQTPVTDNLLQ